MREDGSWVRHGLGDPRIPWVVLLDLRVEEPPSVTAATASLAKIAARAGRESPSVTAVIIGPHRYLLGTLATGGRDAIRVGLHEHGLVLAGRHDTLDGMALVTVAGLLLDVDLRSGARGVGSERRETGRVQALASRAWEIAARPPARVATSVRSGRHGDSFAATTVKGTPRTADLIRAGAHAIATWNGMRGRSAQRVSVAVGVSTVGGSPYELGDRSAFLRLRGVERMDRDEIRQQLAHAPLQPGGGRTKPLLAEVAGVVLRLAAPRLGSTLLVSHLGTIDAPESVDVPMFYPVTGGGSGLSLGAATMRGSTTLTLRSRATQHDDEGLQQLLALVVEEIGATVQ